MSKNMLSSKKLGPLEVEKLVGPLLLRPLQEHAYEQLARYVAALYRWNARMNLTAVRDPAALVQLHVGECLRAAQLIPAGVSSVLDFGSGACLPGIPMQIARPDLTLTLAESQGKKASFLREAIRELGLKETDVHAGRVEDLAPEARFDLVTLRAVDKMAIAMKVAAARIKPGGGCMVLTSAMEQQDVQAALPNVEWMLWEAIPGTEQRIILLGFGAK